MEVDIRVVSMKAGMILLVILVGSLVPSFPEILAGEIDPSKVVFYMYGAYWCPNCRDVKKGIAESFGTGSLVYYEIEGNNHNGKLFSELYSITGISGIPATAIFYDGHLYAVIEGTFNITRTGRIINEARKSDGVLLFTRGRVYLMKGKKAEKLQEIFLSGQTDGDDTVSPLSTNSQESARSQTTASVCGPGLLVLLPLLILLARRFR